MADEFLFVYGTLKRSASTVAHRTLRTWAEYVSPATYHGRLYMVDWYPAAVPSEVLGELVYGEVYRLIDPCRALRELDRYEGCAGAASEYRRCQGPVVLPDGETLCAWIYLYRRNTEGLRRIESGVFVSADEATD